MVLNVAIKSQRTSRTDPHTLSTLFCGEILKPFNLNGLNHLKFARLHKTTLTYCRHSFIGCFNFLHERILLHTFEVINEPGVYLKMYPYLLMIDMVAFRTQSVYVPYGGRQEFCLVASPH